VATPAVFSLKDEGAGFAATALSNGTHVHAIISLPSGPFMH
jgi:hypothetical protein